MKGKKFFKTIDGWFDKFMGKAGQKPFLEYLVKYLMACGICVNVAGIVFILILIFK